MLANGRAIEARDRKDAALGGLVEGQGDLRRDPKVGMTGTISKGIDDTAQESGSTIYRIRGLRMLRWKPVPAKKYKYTRNMGSVSIASRVVISKPSCRMTVAHSSPLRK